MALQRLARKNSIPFDMHKPQQPHNFMHNKLVLADDNVIMGSFNLSNHAMGNAENVLLIKDSKLAEQYETYLAALIARYRALCARAVTMLTSLPSSCF
jgi:phosphatidylserine/phosphatidylglycerophosphate/cardiolipin synthase-like enzyme